MSKILYRFVSNNVGIYEAFKKQVSANKWREFLKSAEVTWLPKPPDGTYESNKYKSYESYFKEKGFIQFLRHTIKEMEEYTNHVFDYDLIKTHQDDIRGDIVYEDEYQIVYGIK